MTTLDPSAKSIYVTLSNGDLTSTSNLVAVGAGCRVRSTATKNDARYTETTVASTNSQPQYVGVCNSSLDMAGFGFSSADLTAIRSDGAYYVGGSYAGAAPSFVAGDVVRQEIRPGVGVRWSVNGKVWTPFRALPSGTDFYCLSMVTPMNDASGSGSQTWNFGGSAFAYTPTATAWDGSPVELITNGAFAADTDWTKGSGVTISGGVATATAANSIVKQSLALTEGRTYSFSMTAHRTSGSGRIRLNLSSTNGANVVYVWAPSGSSQTLTCTFIAPSGATDVAIEADTNTFTGTVDNVSLSQTAVAPSLGTEMVSNGTFDDTSVWTAAGNSPINTGRANPSGSGQFVRQPMTYEVGAQYRVTLNYSMSGGSKIRINVFGYNDGRVVATSAILCLNATGFLAFDFTSIDTTQWIGVEADSAFYSGWVDNISLKKILPPSPSTANRRRCSVSSF